MGFAEDVETILADTPDDKQVALFSATMPPPDPPDLEAVPEQPRRDHGQEQDLDRHEHHASATSWSSYPHKIDALTRILEVENFEAHDRLRPHQERHREAGREAAGPRLLGRGDQRRRRPGPARAHGQPAEDGQARHPRRHRRRRARPRRRAHQPRRQLRHPAPTPSPTCTASAAPAAPAAAARRSAFVTPRERHLLEQIERATRQPLTADAAAERRRRQRHAASPASTTRSPRRSSQTDRIERFRDIIAHYVRNHDVPEVDVAAALAVVAQGETPLLLSTEDRAPRRPSHATATTAAARAAPTAMAGPSAAERRQRRTRRRRRWRRTASPSASATRSSRARSSAPSPTRAASSRRTSAHIDIRPDFSLGRAARPTCRAPPGTKLDGTRICGKLIELTPDAGRPVVQRRARARKPRHKG